jgi:gamma-glutamyltranspeptidase
MAYPEPSEEDEYPEQIFDYCISPPNISSFGGYFFAVANDTSLRIIGGVVEHLVKYADEGKNVWENVNQPLIEDITISRDEINEIMAEVKEYASSLLK